MNILDDVGRVNQDIVILKWTTPWIL